MGEGVTAGSAPASAGLAAGGCAGDAITTSHITAGMTFIADRRTVRPYGPSLFAYPCPTLPCRRGRLLDDPKRFYERVYQDSNTAM
jgi:hypothetical protein